MDNLDRLLKEWGGRRKVDETKTDFLIENICREIRRGRDEISREAPRSRGISTFWLRFSYASLGAVVALIVVVAVRQQVVLPVSRGWQEPTMEFAPPTRLAAVSQEDIKRNLRVLKEVNDVFPGSLRWMQISNDGLNLELTSRPGEGRVSSDNYVIIHITVFKRQVGMAWESVWATEVTAAPEELIQVSLDGQIGSLNFWAHILPDGLLAIDSDMKLGKPLEVATSYSGILKPGIPKRVLLFNTGDIEYSVFEAVNSSSLKSDTT